MIRRAQVPILHAMSPSGRQSNGFRVEPRSDDFDSPLQFSDDSGALIVCERCTEDGEPWAENCFPSFFSIASRPFFALRTYWGDTKIFDLERGQELRFGTDEYALAYSGAEIRERSQVATYLEKLDRFRNAMATEVEWQLIEKSHGYELRFAKVALRLVGLHRMKDCIEYLRAWERVEYYESGVSLISTGNTWSATRPKYRAVVRHSLKLLDHVPTELPMFRFGFKFDEPTFPVANRSAEDVERIHRLKSLRSPEEIIKFVGSPDHISDRQFPLAGAGPHELWEFDFREKGEWKTATVCFGFRDQRVQLLLVDVANARWFKNNRRAIEVFE